MHQAVAVTGRISLTVNGRRIESTVEPRTHLADFIRDTLRLTGTHLGCEHGVCGACTVLVDGAPIRSCITFAIACEGAHVRTIEAFEHDPLMRTLREAFARRHALQCGYCTPGMLLTAYDIVRRIPGADESRVREELSGNLCRCTGYIGIVEALKAVLGDLRALENGGTGTAHSGAGSTPAMDELRAHGAANTGIVDDTGTSPGNTSRESPQQVSVPPSVDAERPSDSPSDSSSAASGLLASALPGASALAHEIAVPVAPDRLWSALRDVGLVVRCLPGASLRGPADADPLSLEIVVAIGPIRSHFQGVAHVVFDGESRTGTLEGKGYDARTRSSSEGSVEFSVRRSRSGGSVLVLEMRYTTSGPLAQFSRGTVVDAVVEQILERFAANLAAAASGRDLGGSPPLGGLRLAFAAVRRWLRRIFPSGEA